MNGSGPVRRRVGCRRLGQCPYFGIGQWPPLPWRKLCVSQRPDSDSNQPLHRMADGIAHPADLAIAAFVDRDAQDAGRRLRDLGWRGHAVVELDSVAQSAHRASGDIALHIDQIFLLDAVARVRQPVGKVTVVGQQQQSLSRRVETAYGIHTRLGGHQLHDCWATLRIVGGAHDARRLIEQQIDHSWLDADRNAVDLNAIVFHIDAAAEHRDFAVHRDAFGCDHVLAHAAAAPTSNRQDFL